MEKRTGFLLHTEKQLRMGFIASSVGFVLYLALSALGWDLAADLTTIVFGVIAVYVFASVWTARKRDKEAVGYNLLWGQGALTILLAGCAVLTVRLRLGL